MTIQAMTILHTLSSLVYHLNDNLKPFPYPFKKIRGKDKLPAKLFANDAILNIVTNGSANLHLITMSFDVNFTKTGLFSIVLQNLAAIDV